MTSVAASDREAGVYAVFADGVLSLVRDGGAPREIAVLPNIRKFTQEGEEHEIELLFRHPFVCVTERFGLNGAVVNVESGAARPISREDEYSDVSTYSAAFAQPAGRLLFICQTQRNRLDVYDAETFELLTEREVYCRDTGRKDARGKAVYEEKNYLDYFHSRLYVSPDGRRFLDSGWYWTPFDTVLLFDTERFLRDFEPGHTAVYSGNGYNWDRPIAWMDDSLFVAAGDDGHGTGRHPLVFYDASAEPEVTESGFRRIKPVRTAQCGIFPVNSSGEAKGKLYFDRALGCLVALTADRGAFALSPEGEISACLPDVFTGDGPGTVPRKDGWDYSPDHHVFYAWKDGGIAQRRF